ncbi:MAG TPA: FAD-dependent oxidoreductase [Thermoanaerobaculia bacterium]|nr:FAD-dependent oxidoreductase [Thermoanaerobaculia bacterium]
MVIASRPRADSPDTETAVPAPAAPAHHVTILGGGPAGLGAAFYAQQRGLDFSLFERAAELGGLCRTFRCGEHLYDSGAHRFHDRDPEITADVQALLGADLARVSSPSQIYDRGRFIDFPPTPLNWVRGRGLGEAAQIGAEILKARFWPRPEHSFEDLATNRYGRRLGEPLLISYTEKLWGLPAGALAPDVATRRLAGLGLRSLLFELFLPRRRRAHLDGSFLYPRSGYGALAARLAARLPADRLATGHDVAGFDCAGGAIRAIRFSGRPAVAVPGRVLSTLPLTVLVRCLGNALPAEARQAAAELRFRHVRLVFLRLGIARHSRNATIYLPDPRLAASRISEPKNRSPAMAPADETGLVVEVPCSTGDALCELAGELLAERVVAELAGIGMLDPRTVLGSETRMLANAYPVYSLDYAERVRAIREALAEIGNLDALGRGGLFWYSHLHDQLRGAKDYVGSLEERDGFLPASISPHILRSARRL